jgi:hypothetical protein
MWLVLGVSAIVVGEKVQVEAAGSPEQEKLKVPERVLVGCMKALTSVVDPSATDTSGTPYMVCSPGHALMS